MDGRHSDTPDAVAAQKMVINCCLPMDITIACPVRPTAIVSFKTRRLSWHLKSRAFLVETEAPLTDESSEFIVIDHKKCIKCGRASRPTIAQWSMKSLDFGFRGHDTKVICDDNLPMGDSSCVQCGECSQICPVGAILDKKAIGKGRAWELKRVDTVCTYCGRWMPAHLAHQ